MKATTTQPTTTVADNRAPSTGPAEGTSSRERKAGRRGRKWLLLLAAVVVIGIAAYVAWELLKPSALPEGFASSNGRIEATEIDIATKAQGRVVEVLAHEGDFVTAGQTVAQMDTDQLNAQLHEAQADLHRAQTDVESATSVAKQRESDKEATVAVVAQREAELDLAIANFDRAKRLIKTNAISTEEHDTLRAQFYSAKAALATAKALVEAANAAISTAKSKIIAAEAAVGAADAKIDKLEAELRDTVLKCPRDGRVQFRITEPGEVLPAGGKVLNMVDLGDVYMTFFLPTDWAGRVRMGAEARIVLDAAPQFVIPAKVTFVADVAQFTPKTVETAEERQKLSFRIKAHIPPELLKEHVRDVKTGLPGVAYVQLDPQAQWPANLQVKLPAE